MSDQAGGPNNAVTGAGGVSIGSGLILVGKSLGDESAFGNFLVLASPFVSVVTWYLLQLVAARVARWADRRDTANAAALVREHAGKQTNPATADQMNQLADQMMVELARREGAARKTDLTLFELKAPNQDKPTPSEG